MKSEFVASILSLILILLLLAVPAKPASAIAGGDIYIVKVADAIGPGVAQYVANGLETAADKGAACVVIELDTPGGLAESMREIVQAIYRSPVPVVVYVSPSGARAASAGVMITLAADIAVMAPGTNIGAAHPVGAGGKEISDTMAEKVTNDMVAFVKSIAERRGRNGEWAEKAVRESVSATETEALEKNIVDLVAEDIDSLLEQIDGRTIEGKGTIDLSGARKIALEETLRDKILKTLSDPNIAYILMMIGLAGLYFELSNPGAIFPGVIGGISLILAFFAFQTLPVNYAGLMLILLAIVFFIMEMKIASFGLLSVAGVISLALGSLMLFKQGGPHMRLAWNVFLPTIILVSGFFVAVATMVFRAQVSKTHTGLDGLIGEIGQVRQDIDPEGKVFVHGELWKATADEAIVRGTRVKVVEVHGLVLKVVPENH
ncbi:MAG: nodulation protein NfeD [Desulfobacterales bacterium]|nr:nodulation protein NfeD [Desulfobacterales bacterium]